MQEILLPVVQPRDDDISKITFRMMSPKSYIADCGITAVDILFRLDNTSQIFTKFVCTTLNTVQTATSP